MCNFEASGNEMKKINVNKVRKERWSNIEKMAYIKHTHNNGNK